MNMDEGLASVCDIREAATDDTLFSTYILRGSSESHHRKSSEDVTNLNKNTDINDRLIIDRLKTYPRIVFLGTVSTQPSPYRNSTSILVHTKYEQY